MAVSTWQSLVAIVLLFASSSASSPSRPPQSMINTKGCEIRVGGDNAPYYRDRKLRLRRREQLGRRMRDILGMTAITIGLKAKPSFAAGPPRALSDVASKIPGYGMADLFFPSYFEGTWDCISDLVDIQMPLGEEMVPNLKEVKTLQRFIGRPEMLLRFNQTYFRYRDHVIAERGANTVSARIAKRFNPETNTWYSPPSGSDGVADAITDVRWEPSNPNVLNYVMNPGQKYEVLVTKRAFEQPAENVFITSEVVRQTQTDLAQMSPPVVKQVKDQVKYKRVAGSEPETIQAILISNVILTPEGDQLEDYLRSGGKPVTTYRTRILMTKLS